MADLIQPRVLKGFRDALPANEIERALLVETLTKTFRSYGFVPIDTPALEYSEILLRKSDGETEKQVFRFQDNGGRDVALRFDLTVPFARFVAEHKDELYFPFKRYHVAKVWRGEKPQAGRYREFFQCDFDIVGSDSAAADFEILSLMRDSLSAIGVEAVTVRLSHRGVFNRFLANLSLKERSEDILRAVDKLAKAGEEEVRATVASFAGEEKAEKILAYVKGAPSGDFDETLALMEEMAGGPDADTERLRDIRSLMRETGTQGSFVLDPSITRGLDYYTGVVYETFLNDLPSIGSVCSGGRYDNLAGLYMKDRVPGVGSSIGLDRLMAGLEELNSSSVKASFTEAAVFLQDGADLARSVALARELRRAGIACEVFPEPKKMAQQYAWAEKKGIPFGILPAQNGAGWAIKNLVTRESLEAAGAAEVIGALRRT